MTRITFFNPIRWSLTVGVILLALVIAPLSSAAQGTSIPLGRMDLTGNGVINAADAWEIVDDWNQLQNQGVCISPEHTVADVDGSGCVDVADMQKVLAQLNAGTSPAVAPQGAGLAAAGNTYTVTTTSDGSDTAYGDGVCKTSGGGCSFRAAIQESNYHPGRDTINFDIRNSDGTCPTGVLVLSPNTDALTTLRLDDRDGAGTVINGYSQCGSSANSQQITGNAVIRIELKGKYQPDVHGLYIPSPNNEVRGLAIYNWDSNILISNATAYNNLVAGNFLGTNASNSFSNKSRTPTLYGCGVSVRYYASNNVIGGTSPADRNIVSGQGNDGVCSQETSIATTVWNNYIGLKQDGVTQLANNSDGMDFDWGSAHNVIGGTQPGQRNVISGNTQDGIELSHIRPGKVSEDNHVIGNYIGISAKGGPVYNASGAVLPAGNGGNGVTLEDNQHTVEIAYNYLSNNGQDGARSYFHGVGHYIHDNVIGLAPDGTRFSNGVEADVSLNHYGDGIWLVGDTQHTVIARNVITGSKSNGIMISNKNEGGNTDGPFNSPYKATDSTDFNTISQNKIYGNDGKGIAFELHDGDAPNEGIKPPVITGANSQLAAGSACPNCTVELFIADQTSLSSKENAGEGKTYIGSATTDAGGVFIASFTQSVNKGQLITATATDAVGNTSMFAKNIAITDTTITPPTPQPVPTDTPIPSPTATETAAPIDESAVPSPAPTNEQPTPAVPGEPEATVTATPSGGAPTGSYTSLLPIVLK